MEETKKSINPSQTYSIVFAEQDGSFVVGQALSTAKVLVMRRLLA